MIRTLLIASAALLPAGLVAQDAAAEYEKLVGTFAAETASFRDADAGVPPLLPDISALHAEFVAAAQRHAGTAEALPFLGWLLQNAPRDPDAHGMAVAALDEAARITAEAADRGGSEGDRYNASRTAVRHLKHETVDDAVFAQTLLDAKILALTADDPRIRAASARSVFKLERLQVGMVAPDIEGTDLDGVAFKLSDYRGQVVVIDFWGDW